MTLLWFTFIILPRLIVREGARIIWRVKVEKHLVDKMIFGNFHAKQFYLRLPKHAN